MPRNRFLYRCPGCNAKLRMDVNENGWHAMVCYLCGFACPEAMYKRDALSNARKLLARIAPAGEKGGV